MQVGTCPNVLEYTSLPDSTTQRHAATIPGIKLSHLIQWWKSGKDWAVGNIHL